MRARVAALIPAAGSGTRLGLGFKAVVEVAGLTLLERAVLAVRAHVDEVIVALPPGATFHAPSGARSVEGGESRQASVRALLSATDAQVVLVHDAARPFLPARVVTDVIQAAQEVGAATAALPVADTLVRTVGAAWLEGVPREDVWAVQTPQGFRREVLLDAHRRAEREVWSATDDAGLVARAGGAVRLVPGDSRLFKVTIAGDLTLARALAPAWDAGRSA